MVPVINTKGACGRFKDKKYRRGISTFIGACILNFVAGAIYSLCVLAVYQISYIKAIGNEISIDHLAFYYPIEILFQCFASILGGIMYKELGLHITNLIGVLILSGGYFVMYFSEYLLYDMLCMILGGIGTGIILYPSTTNAYRWFPEHNGIIVGVMETMISLGSFTFSFLGEIMINKKKEPSSKETDLYSPLIAVKIKDYLIIQIFALLAGFILSFFFMFIKEEDNKKNIMSELNLITEVEDENDKDSQDTVNGSNVLPYNYEPKDTTINPNNNNYNLKINDEKKKKKKDNKAKIKNNTEDDDIDKKKKPLLGNKEGDNDSNGEEIGLLKLLKFTFKSERLVLFSLIMVLQSPVSNMAFTLYREIGEYKKIDVKYLQLVGSLYFIFECLSSFVFGILCDYIQLKNLLLFINIVGTIVGYIYCLTFQNGLIFFIVQNFLSFSSGGYYSVKDCYLMKVFGNDLYIELNGLVSFLVALTVNLLTPITYIVQSNIKNKEVGYWILFVSFGTLNLIGLILNFFLKETPVDLKAQYILKKRGRLNSSLSYFRSSFRHSFHKSFYKSFHKV